MEKGIIRSYGKYAVTIENSNKEQFYGPFINVENKIFYLLNEPFEYINVTYKIDYSKFSGKIENKKRYYAYDIKTNDIIVL